MADATSPIVAATAFTAAGVATGGLQIGIDPFPIIWGFAGGCAALLNQGSVPLPKMLIQLCASALTAGAMTQFIAFYISRLVDAPSIGIVSMVAFLLGLTAQKLIPALQDNVSGAIGAVLDRFRVAKAIQPKE